MVKFGRHQQFVVDHYQNKNGNGDSNDSTTAPIFIVPYNTAKTQYIERVVVETGDNGSIIKLAQEFEAQWRIWLQQARQGFDASLQALWRTVFLQLGSSQSRGAPPEKALLLFCDAACKTEIQNVLERFKSLHETALLNAEALRKLVKKWDKHHAPSPHSSSNNNSNPPCSEQLREEKKEASTKGDWKDDKEDHETNKDQPTAATAATTADEAETSATPNMSLSCALLPEVYAANFVIGLSSLQQGADLLRSELGLGEYATTPGGGDGTPTSPAADNESTYAINIDDNTGNNVMTDTNIGDTSNTVDDDQQHVFTMLAKKDRKDSHAQHMESVDRRRQELHWLQQSVQRIHSLRILPNLVAHRGFHSPQDRSDKRPLENSLQAYESAWTRGVHLCECDIALTKDEQLILAHDKDFSRLALDTSCEKSRRNVRDLTFPEIMSVALSSGVRPPLLLDVLQSAHAIGGQSQLIIEIKPGNREAASALARLFAKHHHLMAHCAVVMSFDSFAMHSLQEEMDALLGTSSSQDNNSNKGKRHYTHRRAYSLGIFHNPVAALTMSASADSAANHTSKSHTNLNSLATEPQPTFARPKLLVLTVCDDPNHEVELQVSVKEDDIHQKIHGWTKGGRLDGVYMQFEPHMLTDEGALVLKVLARRYHVGIWGHNGRDPDDCDTFAQLVQKGNASFVNTDLPRDFFKHHTHAS